MKQSIFSIILASSLWAQEKTPTLVPVSETVPASTATPTTVETTTAVVASPDEGAPAAAGGVDPLDRLFHGCLCIFGHSGSAEVKSIAGTTECM